MVDLPAGRELDALVAEKVMGWERLDPNGVGYFQRPKSSDDVAWWCTMGGMYGCAVQTPSAPLAICYAALAFVTARG